MANTCYACACNGMIIAIEIETMFTYTYFMQMCSKYCLYVRPVSADITYISSISAQNEIVNDRSILNYTLSIFSSFLAMSFSFFLSLCFQQFR